jgi:hypothetical protein
MTVTRVKTTAGWIDLNTTGPKGDKGDPGYYEYSYIAAGSVIKDFSTSPSAWSSLAIPTSTININQPTGAFVVNPDGSMTVRDTGVYDIEASIGATSAWATANVRMITGLGVGVTAAVAIDSIARADSTPAAGTFPSTTLAGSYYLAGGSIIWLTYFGQANAGSASCGHFSIKRVGAGSPGAKGDQGIIAAYSQPNDPGAVAQGTIWVDTDQGIPLAGVNSITSAYAVTAGYTKDRAFNPASSTINEIAAVLATLIDDMKTAGLINP